MFAFQGRAVVTFDVRTQTEYGTLRTYMNLGYEQSTQGNWPNFAVTPGATTTAEGPVTKEAAGNGTYNNRAFIQFAGFTDRPHAVLLRHRRDGRLYLWGQPPQRQLCAGRHLWHRLYRAVRRRHFVELLGGRRWRGNRGARALCDGSFAVHFWRWRSRRGAEPGQLRPRRSSIRSWACVLDQSWGYASITGAFHNDSGGYYNNAINSTNALLANTIVQGHPGDIYGYAGAAGFLLTDFLGIRGRYLRCSGSIRQGCGGLL